MHSWVSAEKWYMGPLEVRERKLCLFLLEQDPKRAERLVCTHLKLKELAVNRSSKPSTPCRFP
jgi:hypothetical protein